MTKIDLLLENSVKLNVELSKEEEEQFLLYKELLKEWNEKINITAIKEDDEIDIKHFLDSLTVLESKLLSGRKKIIDIGTGGGFPGLPLKIVNKDLDVTLLDSLNKRIVFLKEVINQLGLKDVQAIHGRAEELSRQEAYREKYDIALSRAVASLDTLSEYCLPFVKVGGYFIAMKSKDIDEELKNSQRAIQILGAKILEKKAVKIPGSDIEHCLVIIEKVKPTAKKYPRGGGKPKKNPL